MCVVNPIRSVMPEAIAHSYCGYINLESYRIKNIRVLCWVFVSSYQL